MKIKENTIQPLNFKYNVLFCIGLFLITGIFQKAANAQDRPNVLILHTDEHNFRTLGCYRELMEDEQAYVWGKDAVVETPNIDFLSSKGVLCTSFYANTPVCTPSRASLVSGLYPQNSPAEKNDVKLGDDVESFAAPMAEAGYVTGYGGKWHLDGHSKPGWAPARNFGFLNNTYMFNRGHWKKLDENEDGPFVAGKNNKGKIDYSLDGADEKTFTTDFLTDRAMKFISENKDNPFCYMISYPDPHGPNCVRAPYNKMYSHLTFETPATAKVNTAGLPKWGLRQSKTIGSGGMATYYGMVKCIDDNIGRLLKHLREKKLIDNTIIVFLSDHGDLLGEHGRDNKGVPYEASAKVPFIIYYPNALKEGAVVDEAISNVDFKPTILSLLGLTGRVPSQGKDVSSLFLKNSTDSDVDDIAFLRGTGSKGSEKWVAAVSDQYKLVYSVNSEPWLIDLELDPDELTNYYDDPEYKTVISNMAAKLRNYGTTYTDPYLKNAKIEGEIEQVIKTEKSVLGSENTSLSKYLVYPNPAVSSSVTIQGLEKESDVEIFNLQGMKVRSIKTSSKVNIEGLGKGVYMLSINSEKKHRLIIE